MQDEIVRGETSLAKQKSVAAILNISFCVSVLLKCFHQCDKHETAFLRQKQRLFVIGDWQVIACTQASCQSLSFASCYIDMSRLITE